MRRIAQPGLGSGRSEPEEVVDRSRREKKKVIDPTVVQWPWAASRPAGDRERSLAVGRLGHKEFGSSGTERLFDSSSARQGLTSHVSCRLSDLLLLFDLGASARTKQLPQQGTSHLRTSMDVS